MRRDLFLSEKKKASPHPSKKKPIRPAKHIAGTNVFLREGYFFEKNPPPRAPPKRNHFSYKKTIPPFFVSDRSSIFAQSCIAKGYRPKNAPQIHYRIIKKAPLPISREGALLSSFSAWPARSSRTRARPSASPRPPARPSSCSKRPKRRRRAGSWPLPAGPDGRSDLRCIRTRGWPFPG